MIVTGRQKSDALDEKELKASWSSGETVCDFVIIVAVLLA